jgi:glucokinase
MSASVAATARQTSAELAIGIDVGGTKIAGGLVDLGIGTVVRREIVATNPERGGQAVLADAVDLARRLAAEATALGHTVGSIGVGVAELVDREGRIRSTHNLALEHLPVRERFAEIAPTTIESDVRAAALGEARYGAGRGLDPFAYVTIGTGISSCLVEKGRPFAGARGNALVLTSAPLTLPCAACGATVSLVLEEYASGPALVARYRARTGRAIDRAEEVFAAVADGDDSAIEVVGSAGDALGSSLGFLVNVLDPAALIVGGGLGVAGGLYWERLVRSTRAHVWSEATRELPILQAALGTDAGLVGAAVAGADVT